MKAQDGSFVSTATTIVSLLCILFGLYQCLHYKIECIEQTTIISVGGCSKKGTCGYTDSHGGHGEAPMPSVGQHICRTQKLVPRW